MNYPWDLVDSNSELTKEDFALLAKEESDGAINQRTVICGKKSNVYVDKEALVTLDARNGPIYISENTVVHRSGHNKFQPQKHLWSSKSQDTRKKRYYRAHKSGPLHRRPRQNIDRNTDLHRHRNRSGISRSWFL